MKGGTNSTTSMSAMLDAAASPSWRVAVRPAVPDGVGGGALVQGAQHLGRIPARRTLIVQPSS